MLVTGAVTVPYKRYTRQYAAIELCPQRQACHASAGSATTGIAFLACTEKHQHRCERCLSRHCYNSTAYCAERGACADAAVPYDWR